MPIDPERLLALDIPEIVQEYGEKDTMFYALSLGLGLDPVDERQLRFVFERELLALPTLPLILSVPGSWLSRPETGIDYLRVVHGEHAIELHRPPASSGRVRGKTRVVDVIDKGPGRGALIYSELRQTDAESGAPLATIRQTTFARADGGFGGPLRKPALPHPLPERAPDLVCDLPTSPQAALLYRLNADRNPLHADPVVARNAGFERPILHGLATFGIAGHAILRAGLDYDPARLRSLSARFTAPVFPGDLLRTELWLDDCTISFRCLVPERDSVVLNNGRATVAQADG